MQNIALISIFAAVAAALGLAFLAIPNLELITVTFFLAGYFLGIRDGMISAVLGEFVYSTLNPMGSGGAFPHILAAQLLGMAVAAFAGGIVAKSRFLPNLKVPNGQIRKTSFQIRTALFLGITGLIITLIFDTLTTVSFLLFIGPIITDVNTSLFYAIGGYFFLIHIGSNTLTFAILLPILTPVLKDRLPKVV